MSYLMIRNFKNFQAENATQWRKIYVQISAPFELIDGRARCLAWELVRKADTRGIIECGKLSPLELIKRLLGLGGDRQANGWVRHAYSALILDGFLVFKETRKNRANDTKNASLRIETTENHSSGTPYIDREIERKKERAAFAAFFRSAFERQYGSTHSWAARENAAAKKLLEQGLTVQELEKRTAVMLALPVTSFPKPPRTIHTLLSFINSFIDTHDVAISSTLTAVPHPPHPDGLGYHEDSLKRERIAIPWLYSAERQAMTHDHLGVALSKHGGTLKNVDGE